MDDIISRKQAIEAFNTNIDELVVAGKENADAVERYLNRVIDEIKQLPPIQPASSSEFPNNSDTISRQQAIDALDKRFDSMPMEQTSEILLLRKDLREMPPIQSAEPKRGRWVGKYPVTSVCSECGYLINDSKVKVFAFCPNCGAEMREVNDESN